jgi:hypothetical protein
VKYSVWDKRPEYEGDHSKSTWSCTSASQYALKRRKQKEGFYICGTSQQQIEFREHLFSRLLSERRKLKTDTEGSRGEGASKNHEVK